MRAQAVTHESTSAITLEFVYHHSRARVPSLSSPSIATRSVNPLACNVAAFFTFLS